MLRIIAAKSARKFAARVLSLPVMKLWIEFSALKVKCGFICERSASFFRASIFWRIAARRRTRCRKYRKMPAITSRSQMVSKLRNHQVCQKGTSIRKVLTTPSPGQNW